MKISYAAQVFSNSVASGINTMTLAGSRNIDGSILIPKEAVGTSNLFNFSNDLFDSVSDRGKKKFNTLRRNVTPRSRHHMFWNDVTEMLQRMTFVKFVQGV